MSKKDIWAFAAIALIGILASLWLPLYDFETFFYPAIVEAANWRDPYTVPGFYAPPWALLPFLPLGWMGLTAAKSLFFAGMLVCFLFIPYKLGLKWWAIVLFVLSPPVLACLWLGNLEWLVLMGLFVPSPVNVLFFLIKPQVGIGLALCSLVERKHHLLTMMLLGILVAIWVAPGWIGQVMVPHPCNTALWPWGLLVGIPMLGLGLRYRDRAFCLVAGPLLSPYVLMYSWAGAILGVIGGKKCQR